ncbi:DUF2849 domain-containing protein [Parasphingopyxis algicola]|uniref:DUF2849 domain-containing protein n=1 Tax=Parasphingopyxis algicola TaxID=2026624 RepID=UPI0015A075F9|nr:DUF2849 domain-containing protein [Parasphingopyxis algicola]QLC23869.1 DUF2849 domain-containing protein [Parasphingopyxis algicola]
MKILTGNDLKTGDVVWWTGYDWSRHVSDAAELHDNAPDVMAREIAKRAVNDCYLVDAERTDDGILPVHIKEKVRATGPTVRPDLKIAPPDPAAGNWVI